MDKMAQDENSWRTNTFRQSVVAKIDEAIQRSGMPTSKNSLEMENHVFQKAKTKEEYLSFVARLILHVREMSSRRSQHTREASQGNENPSQDPRILNPRDPGINRASPIHESRNLQYGAFGREE